LALGADEQIPQLGYGVFQVPAKQTELAVAEALSIGYRHIDTAAAYGNEREVGDAVRASGVARSEVFLETKIWISDYGYDETLHGFEKSAGKLGVEQIDLLILHQALPSAFDRTLEAYRALETLLADGKVRAIGVSNFTVDHLTRLLDQTTVVPAVNQIELHPYFPQVEMRAVNADRGIQTESWSPLGKRQAPFAEPAVADAAEAHGVTPGQVILRWQVQLGSIPIPKSATPERQRANLDVFGFELTDAEMAAITALGRPDGRLFGGDPDTHEEF
jgi:2,5-diketo-D-gluconate reductase A